MDMDMMGSAQSTGEMPRAVSDLPPLGLAYRPRPVASQLMTEDGATYELCISFMRDGLTARVPWVFVLYATGAEKGTRSKHTFDPTHLC